MLTLIRGFQSGAINPKTISMESRRACVEHLTADGYSVPEIAQILQASARNIARDRAAMREAHSVEASPALTRQMVGHMLREAEIAVNRLRRFARGNDAAIIEKIEAEKSAWGVTRDMLQMLQRLGYLPSAPSVIQGHVMHQQLESLKSPEELQREVLRLERICLEDPAMAGDPHALQIIKQVKNTAKTLAAPARSNSDRPTERRPS